MNQLTIRRWFDRHLHLRRGKMLGIVLPCTLQQRVTGAVLMGNHPSPYETSTIEKALAYRQEVDDALPPDSDFEPVMTCYLTDDITPEEVVRGYKERVWRLVKLYMADRYGKGGTTGSQHGVRNLRGRYRVFEAMQENGIPLAGHLEAVEDDVDEFDREVVSLERDLMPLCRAFPKLPIIVEHVSDHRMADFVAEVDHPIHATVTVQHITEDRNALFRGGLNPVKWCKPVLKRKQHQLGVRKYVTSGNPRFGAGTDSAPWDEVAKARYCTCAAGDFTAPHAVELYTEVFEEDGALEHLEAFLSENFLDVYGMSPSDEMMTIERQTWTIPEKIGPVVIHRGGKELRWKLVG